MRLCFFLEPLEPRLTFSAGFIATDGLPGGALTLDLGHSPNYLSFAFQTDGKIVLSEYGFNSDSDCGSFLLRFNRDGSLDRALGANSLSELCDTSGINQLLALPDGSFFASAWEGVFRFKLDGQIDSSFTSDAALADMDFIEFIVPAGDGDILVAGETRTDDYAATPSQLALVRLNSDGTPDLSFGVNGALAEEYASPFDSDWDMAVQPDGKVLVEASDGDGYHANLLRFNADGTPDDSFASHGQFSFAAGEDVGPMLLQPDGKIVVILDTLDLTLARLNPDGSLDHSFGHDGRASFWWHKYHYWETGFLQSDGKIIAIAEDNIIARFNSDGSLDSTFGFGGAIQIVSPDPQFDYLIDDAALRGDHLLLSLRKGTLNSDGDWHLLSAHLLDITTGSNTPSTPISADANFVILSPGASSPNETIFAAMQAGNAPQRRDQTNDNASTPEDFVWDDSDDALDWQRSDTDSTLN